MSRLLQRHMATHEAKLLDWKEVRLGDLVSIKHGWPFKSEYFSEELSGRPIVVGIGNFTYTGGFRFESTPLKEYRGDYPREFELRPNDILLVMTCQTSGGEILGIPGRIPSDGRIYLHNQRLGRIEIRDPKALDPDFLYFLFLWPEFNRHAYATASGTRILHTAPSRMEGCVPQFVEKGWRPPNQHVPHSTPTQAAFVQLSRTSGSFLYPSIRRK